ncbi:MAG: MNIO family bufferin maturase [Candidatus Binataceae bacterium]
MAGDDFPFLGFGVGLRRLHYEHVVNGRPPIDWFEIISENFMAEGGRPLRVLEAVRRDYSVVMHGVSLSIGSTDPLNRRYLGRLRALADRIEPAWISDHLCWTGVGGHNLHDLIPIPYTDEAVRHVAVRVIQAQEILGRRILLENISSYMTYAVSSLTEWDFIGAVAERANCAILLDINNVYVSAFNQGFDPIRYIDAIAPERVAQFHLAGYSDHGRYLLDSHDHPVSEAVWSLYEYAVRRFGPISTLIEWDDLLPDFAVLTDAAIEARNRAAIESPKRLATTAR